MCKYIEVIICNKVHNNSAKKIMLKNRKVRAKTGLIFRFLGKTPPAPGSAPANTLLRPYSGLTQTLPDLILALISPYSDLSADEIITDDAL